MLQQWRLTSLSRLGADRPGGRPAGGAQLRRLVLRLRFSGVLLRSSRRRLTVSLLERAALERICVSRPHCLRACDRGFHEPCGILIPQRSALQRGVRLPWARVGVFNTGYVRLRIPLSWAFVLAVTLDRELNWLSGILR
jgi:hypothetical protein